MLSRDPRQAGLDLARLNEDAVSSVASEQPVPQVEPVKPEPLSLLLAPKSMPGSEDTVTEIPELDRLSPKFTPQDPFDPEIFNRNHGK